MKRCSSLDHATDAGQKAHLLIMSAVFRTGSDRKSLRNILEANLYYNFLDIRTSWGTDAHNVYACVTVNPCAHTVRVELLCCPRWLGNVIVSHLRNALSCSQSSHLNHLIPCNRGGRYYHFLLSRSQTWILVFRGLVTSFHQPDVGPQSQFLSERLENSEFPTWAHIPCRYLLVEDGIGKLETVPNRERFNTYHPIVLSCLRFL